MATVGIKGLILRACDFCRSVIWAWLLFNVTLWLFHRHWDSVLLACNSCVHGTLSYVNWEPSVTFSWMSCRKPCTTCGRRLNCVMITRQLIWRSVICCIQWAMPTNHWSLYSINICFSTVRLIEWEYRVGLLKLVYCHSQ